MKNLSNCKPSEFFKQTVKIRKYVADWLEVTKIFEIRKKAPVFTAEMSVEEKKALLSKQAKQNLLEIFDSLFDEHGDKTLGLIALMCFVEPEDADNYEVGDYLLSVSELLDDERVISFFTSLMRLGTKNTSKPANQ